MPTQQSQSAGGTRFNKTVTVGASLTTLATLVAGVLLYVNGYSLSKGSDVNIVGDLAIAEINGSASGAQAIQNPINEDVYCDQVILDVTTFGTAFNFDMGTAANATTSGSDIVDNFRVTSTGIFSFSGSALKQNGWPKPFKLSASGSTTDYVTLFSRAGSGHISGKYNLRCRRRV